MSWCQQRADQMRVYFGPELADHVPTELLNVTLACGRDFCDTWPKMPPSLLRVCPGYQPTSSSKLRTHTSWEGESGIRCCHLGLTNFTGAISSRDRRVFRFRRAFSGILVGKRFNTGDSTFARSLEGLGNSCLAGDGQHLS